MTLVQLSYIVALDQHKNFGMAAEKCGVTQPTLSMQIQKLEDDLGVLLFDRSHIPVKTTKIGERLIKQAKVVLDEAQKFESLVKEDKEEIKGQLNLAVIPTLAPYLVPLFITKFHEKYPGLDISIFEMQTHEILEQIKNNKIDIGILVTPIEDDKLESLPLFYEPFLAYVSEKSALLKSAKVQTSDLNASDIWLLSEGHCFRDQTLAVCKSRKKASDEGKHLRFESGSLETLRKMVDEEGGFTLMPYLATRDLGNTKKLKEFQNPVPTREVSLIFSKFYRRDQLKQALVENIKSSLPKGLSMVQTKNTQVIDLPMGRS